MKVSFFKSTALSALLLLGLSSCEKDENRTDGNVSFEITDAPIDDANIEGVFVTVASLRVNGEEIDDFSGKQTIDLMAYQNGKVKFLGGTNLEAGTYSDIRLVLDYDRDANGNSPGTYVLTKDGVKHALKAGANASTELKITNGTLTVPDNGDVTAVIDMDLRKAVMYGSSSSDYQFVSDTELAAAARLAVKSQTGTIEGELTDNLNLAGEKVVVYAYKKGQFNSSESNPQGTSGIRFKNAVSSTLMDDNGNYKLSFLEAGDYELHFVGYQDLDSDGQMEEKGSLILDVLGALNLDAVTVSAGATIDLDVSVTGFLPL